MSLKRLATTISCIGFALSACGSGDNNADSGADTGSETEQTLNDSAKDLIEQAKEESGEASPEYGIAFYGTWTDRWL